MKSLFLSVLISFSILCPLSAQNNYGASRCGIELTKDTNPRQVSILFIGNSHIYKNNLPLIIAKMAQSMGDNVYAMVSAPGGYDLKSHSVLDATLSAIKAKKWNYVVLQESGNWGAVPANIAETMVYPYAKFLNAKIKENNPATEVVLYMTQGYKHGAAWASTYPNLSTYAGMQEAVKNNYITMSALLQARLAPAGMLWKIIMQKDPRGELFEADGYHPNVAGSYISACTIFATIFHKKMIGAYAPEELSKAEAAFIQNTVCEVLFNCNPDWRKQ